MNEPLPPNNNNLPPQGIGVNAPKRTLPVLGIVGILMGGVAFLPLAGISVLSPIVQVILVALGLLLGFVAIFKQQLISGVVAAAVCVAALVLNPALKTLATCAITPSAEQCDKKGEGTKLDIKIPGEGPTAQSGNDAKPATPQAPLAAPADPLPLMEAPAAAPAQPAAPAVEQVPSAPAAEAPLQPQAMPDAAAVPPQGQVAPAAPVEQAPTAPATEQAPAPVPEQPAAQPVAEPATAQ